MIRAALAQLPGQRRPGKNLLIRGGRGGGTHEPLDWLTRRRLSYSVGFSLPDAASLQAKPAGMPAEWTPAYDAEGQLRPGAWAAELIGLVDLSGWPPGMRLMVRKERPHPGAQLRVTTTNRGRVADLDRRPARGHRPPDA